MKLADACGWHGHRVERAEAVGSELDNAFAEEGPSLVVVPVDYCENRFLTERLKSIDQPI